MGTEMSNYECGTKDQIELLTQRIANHLAREPVKPKGRQIIFDDTTSEAFKAGLHENNPSIGIISDEASEAINGRAFGNIPMISSAWNGGDIRVNRRSGNYVIKNSRVTVALMIQNGAIRDFLDGRGRKARDLGLLARFLPAFPASTMGFRFYNSQAQSWEHMDKYHARIADLLTRVEKRDLELSPDAQVAWIAAYNNIESHLAPGSAFTDVKDFASKLAENILRIAAIFHALQEDEGNVISADTVNRAITVCQWYAGEFTRLFSPNHGIPEEQVDAESLAAWFLAHQNTRRCTWINGLAYFKTAELLRYGPNHLRKHQQRVDAALDYLALHGRIQFSAMGNASYVQLIPQSHSYTPSTYQSTNAPVLGHI